MDALYERLPVDTVCKDLVTKLRKCVGELEDVLKEIGKDVACNDECHPVALSSCYSTSPETSFGRAESHILQSSASNFLSPSHAALAAQYSELFPVGNDFDFQLSSYEIAPYPEVENFYDIISNFTFDDHLVSNVLFLEGRGMACTSVGLCPVLAENTEDVRLSGTFVKDACQINAHKMLILTSDSLQVHRIDDNFNSPAIFVLPVPQPGCQFDCIAVGGYSNSIYFAADTANNLIHTWSSSSRSWGGCIEIDYLHYRGVPKLHMCGHEDQFYLSLRNSNEVVAVGVDNYTVWRNNRDISQPTGMAVDENTLYVCQGVHANCCVVLLNLDGSLRTRILHAMVEIPWAIAVDGERIMVLERHHDHELSRSPIKLKIFQEVPT